MSIAILLTTYNGSRYLKEQLESILNQTYKDWTLYIHDDQSTDNTIDIINEYLKKDYRIKYIPDNIRRGSGDSFLYLLSLVSADLYMFCDQDDIWIKSKVEEQYNKIYEINQKYSDVPLLVVCDLMIVDSHMQIIVDSLWNDVFRKYFTNSNHPMLYSIYAGCSMIFNNAAKNHIDYDNKLNLLHDQLVTISVASNHGIIEYVDKPLIKYRQHAMNVVGYNIIKNKWINRVRQFNVICKKWNQQRKIAKKYFGKSFIRYIYLYLKSKV